MVKPRRPASFSEILDAVMATPAAEPSSEEPRIRADGTLFAPDGYSYTKTVSDISSASAFKAATDGARVAWDYCGCGGYCTPRWFDEADVAGMVAAGRPNIRRTKRAHGSIAEYRSETGRVLLLVQRDVQWGNFLA